MRRHVIVTLGRSGSNTLVNLLNQHPNILNVGEVLGDWNRIRQLRNFLNLYPNNTADYLDAITNKTILLKAMITTRSIGRTIKLKPKEIKRIKDIETIGFKEFSTLMISHGQEKWLAERSDVKVIGLIRDDIVGRLVSWQLLKKTGVVLKGASERYDPNLITIDPREIESLLNTIDLENLRLKELLGQINSDRCFIIQYDEFYKSEDARARIISDLFHFLEVPPIVTSIRMGKIVTRAPASMIKNREDCAMALRNTRFDGFLDLN